MAGEVLRASRARAVARSYQIDRVASHL